MKYQAPFGSSDPNASYVDRSNPSAVMGSRVPAAAVEHVQREMVAVISNSGIAPSELDLAQGAKAVRSQALNFRAAGGSAEALSVTLTPAPSAWAELLNVPIDVRISTTNLTAAPTFAVVGLAGSVAIKRRDGSALQARDLLAGSVHRIRYDGAVMRLEAPSAVESVSVLDVLTLYVRPDGSDSNGGLANTAADALQTINEAVKRAYRVSGSVIIQLGVASTYSAWDPIYAGRILIRGDVLNQENYIIAGLGPIGGGANVFSCTGGFLQISGVRLHNTGPSNNTASCSASGYMSLDRVTFTSASSSIYSHIASAEASMVYVGAGCKVGGTMASAMLARIGGIIVQTADLGASAGATFGTFARAIDLGCIVANPGAVLSGANAGKRYSAENCGVIDTYGAGVNFYPGTVAGTVSNGGIYV